MGIALGTVSAVALPLAGAMFGLGKAFEDAGDQAADAAETATGATIEMARIQETANKEEAAAVQRKAEMTEALREITTARYAYNEAIQEGIDILKEEQQIENEIADAKGQLEIDQAEGDPVKQEAVKNRVRKEAQARELAQLEAQRKAASELIDRKGVQEREVGDNGAAEASSLRSRAEAAGAEALQQEQLAALKKAGVDEKTATAEKSKGAAQAALKREAAKLREEYQQAMDKAKSLRAQENDLTGQAGTVDAATKAEVDRLGAEANQLFDEVEKLKREAGKKQQIFGIRDQQGDLRESRVKTQTEAAREKQQEQADAKAARKASQAALTTVQDDLDASARIPGLNMRAAGNRRGNDTLQAVGKALSDGTNAGELQKLGDMVREAQGKNGEAITAMMMQIITGLSEQSKQLEILKKQIKNK